VCICAVLYVCCGVYVVLCCVCVLCCVVLCCVVLCCVCIDTGGKKQPIKMPFLQTVDPLNIKTKIKTNLHVAETEVRVPLIVNLLDT